MSISRLFHNFSASHSGSVSVDWVVLTASILLFGLAVFTVVETAINSSSADIKNGLESAVNVALN